MNFVAVIIVFPTLKKKLTFDWFKQTFLCFDYMSQTIKLKYVSKICGLNFEIVAIARPCSDFSRLGSISKL